ncbi:hypothetical protein K4K53_005315 [Colletotrichum sp. SAR 10_77]|nr:hypothetical protein K4K53_005315 [Colletotrichum sp. SAR 10_77]
MYIPLKASRREVRLLSIRSDLHKLDGGNMPRDSIPDGTLMCTMKTVSLKDWTSDYAAFRAKTIDWPYSPTTLYEKWEHFSREKAGCTDDDTPTPDRFVWGDYETISYTWENGSNTQHTICVNDRPFVVQDNLYQALQEFRRGRDFVEGRTRMLWADAICIDQDDLDERAIEVKRMNEIFSTAIKSTVWLGPFLDIKGADTKVYFDLIGQLIDSLYGLALSGVPSTDDLQSASTELASSEAESLGEHDGSTALEDMMQLVNLWTLPQVRLITTTSGYLGMAAQLVKQGDMIYAVEGYGCPVILRPIKNAGTFEFIGLAEIWSPA